jgi:hypothetical protein
LFSTIFICVSWWPPQIVLRKIKVKLGSLDIKKLKKMFVDNLTGKTVQKP